MTPGAARCAPWCSTRRTTPRRPGSSLKASDHGAVTVSTQMAGTAPIPGSARVDRATTDAGGRPARESRHCVTTPVRLNSRPARSGQAPGDPGSSVFSQAGKTMSLRLATTTTSCVATAKMAGLSAPRTQVICSTMPSALRAIWMHANTLATTDRPAARHLVVERRNTRTVTAVGNSPNWR